MGNDCDYLRGLSGLLDQWADDIDRLDCRVDAEDHAGKRSEAGRQPADDAAPITLPA